MPQQTAVPTRGGVKSALAPLHRKTIDPTKPLLEIRGLSEILRRHSTRSRDIDLDVMPGSIVGIIGPNGSGKTTLFNLITGLTQPDGGKVRLAGEDVTGLLAARDRRARHRAHLPEPAALRQHDA